MPFETLAGKAISSTYNRLVQTDGVYLADGTGSLINNLTLPGNLVVSGTLYAQNTVVVTQSFSSGSNILGDAVDDFQTLYGTVRIPTGSFTVTGSVTSTDTIISTAVSPNYIGFATSGSPIDSVGYHTNVWRGTKTGVAFSFVANAYTSSAVNYVLAGTRPSNPTFAQFQLYVKTDNTTVLDTYGGGPIIDIANNATSYARFDGSNFSIGATSALSKLYISGSSSQALLRIDAPASSSILFVSGSGQVGIGTSTPNTTTRLHVVAPAGADAIHTNGTIYFTDSSKYLYWAGGSYVGKSEHYFGSSNYEWKSFDGATVITRMNINASSGNVGVGMQATAPSARLQVRGSGTTSATTAFRVDNVSTSASMVVLDNGYVGIGTTTPAYNLDVIGTARIGANSNVSANINVEVTAGGSGNNALIDYGYFSTFDASIWKAGYFGNDGGKFKIQSTATGNAFDVFVLNGTSTFSFLTGSVGIGTTNPVSKLTVFEGATTLRGAGGASNTILEIIQNTGSVAGAHFIGDGGNDTRFELRRTSDGFTQTRLRPNADSYINALMGNLGVGTSTPTAKLHISGSPGTGSAVAIYKSGSNVLSIDGSSGRLFSVDDSLSGSLFSVNTAAGLPTIEAFSDNTVNIGKYNVYPIKVVSNGTAAAITGSFSGSIRATSITLTGSLNVTGSQNYVGDVNILGTLTATVKSFLIEHPTQPGKKLQYGNLEGPEHAVYFRGRSTSSIIEFPEEWAGLVNEETVTVQLTPVGGYQPLYVSNITSTRVEIQVAQPMALNYHYLIHGERKDIDKLITTVN